MIENCVSGYLYNELFSESNEEKCTPFQRMAWSLIVRKNPIKNCSTAPKNFPSGPSLCILYFIFHKGKDTSAVPQPSFQHIVYVLINALMTSS